jgi:DnaJ-class molecular chaperone
MRISEIVRNVRSWDWASIVDTARENEGCFFLGTCFDLAPSGKYYTPFANSNVDACPRCKGDGRARKLTPCERCKGTGKLPYAELAQYPFWQEELTKRGFKPGDDVPCLQCDGKGQILGECKYCGGLGSREAYEDEVFYDELERQAEEHGGWIESGEGDPCDLFFGISVAEEESEDEE